LGVAMLPKLIVIGLFYTLGQANPNTKIKKPYIIISDKNKATKSSNIEDNNLTTESGGNSNNCDQIMANNGFNYSTFSQGIAHGIHSLFLEEIREYFEPDAPVNNKIPVLNNNLSSEQTILSNAPLVGYSNALQTMSMKVMSYFMLNDNPAFYQHGVNTLEKINHQYHMHEVFKAASPIYKRWKQNPPKDKEFCGCVNDVIGNGIMNEMVNIAKQLKNFGSKKTARKQCPGGWWQRYSYRYIYVYWCKPMIIKGKKMSVKDNDDNIARYEEAYLANPTPENALKLLNVKPWVPNTLVGPEQWVSYQAMLTYSMLDEEELNNFATFMYCKLNQPDDDGPRELFQ